MTLVATQVKRRRGTTAENDAFTGAEGEITVDTTTHELRVHDGSTVGGHILYTKSDVDTALAGKTNTDLSNLTSAGVSKLGPKIYKVAGFLINSAADTAEGHGVAEVYLYPNGIAIIEFSIQCTRSGTSTSYFNWGINRDLIHALNPEIPIITPTGGIETYYATSGNVAADRTGYGGTLFPVGVFWQPARIFNTSGAEGGWPAGNFIENQRIVGTARGTYTV